MVFGFGLRKFFLKMPAGLIGSGKGFLGPIGDDLPSLIPLVFALTIFFFVFTFTWNTFDEKNSLFEDDLTVLRVAASIKSNGYISGYNHFLERCKESKGIEGINFVAGLLPLYVTQDQLHFTGIDIEADRFWEKFFTDTSGNLFMCTNIVDLDQAGDIMQANPLLRSFPVALERDYVDPSGSRHFFVKTMLLVVVSW